MEEIIKICPNCHRTAAYDPYFKSYICRQCGYEMKVMPKKSIYKHMQGRTITKLAKTTV